jgi:hypothetical protein
MLIGQLLADGSVLALVSGAELLVVAGCGVDPSRPGTSPQAT